MAHKSRPPPAPQPPTIPPDEGVRLLREQIARAEALLAERMSEEDDFQNWLRSTNQVLADALGEGHSLKSNAVVAGSPRRVLTGGEDRVALLRERVRREMRALEPCIEHLQREMERMRASTDDSSREGSHDTALVCRKGHLITDTVHSAPAYNSKFCEKCGAEAISECPACRRPIRGVRLGGAWIVHIPGPPAHCQDCGAPFPWTEARLKAVSELLAMSDVSDADQAALRDSLPALSADSPETPVAIAKWRKFLTGPGKLTASGFKEILVQVVGEAIKRKMFPD